MRYFLLSVLCISSLFADKVCTFYGEIDVEEPLILELIGAPAFQRLKAIHQYGIAYYTTHPEEYNRFDHSLGVFALLRKSSAPFPEQIAGLLHDASHTVFSHVGDFVFQDHEGEDYQTSIHAWHLTESGLSSILQKYGYAIEDLLPHHPEFTRLEQKLPNLSADRIDYNIQGAYFQGFLTKQETIELFEDLEFIQGKWVTTRQDLAKKTDAIFPFYDRRLLGKL